MSPVEQGGGHGGRALIISAVTIAVVLLALWGAAWAASRQDSTDIGIGDQTFQGARTDRMAAEIADRGPILFPDVSGSSDNARPIILQHLGDDEDEGWYAFLAYPSTKSPDCFWRWDADEEIFRASCDDALTLPADGEGAEQFPVEVEDGRLDIDLNYERRQATSTTTTVLESGDVPPSTTEG